MVKNTCLLSEILFYDHFERVSAYMYLLKFMHGGDVHKGYPKEAKTAFIAVLALPMQIFIRGASESIVAILLAYNGFLYTQATRRLAKIILPSCLAR